MKLELLLHLFILTVEVPKYHTEDGRIARDESKKNVYVSSDMTYTQYKEKFIKKEFEIDRVKRYNLNTNAKNN